MIVKGYQSWELRVIMIGDGVNDAPAIVGMVMGTVRTDTVIEAADVALMGDGPCRVVGTLRLVERSRCISTQNLVISLLVLATLIPGAVIGMTTIANGLRVARRIR